MPVYLPTVPRFKHQLFEQEESPSARCTRLPFSRLSQGWDNKTMEKIESATLRPREETVADTNHQGSGWETGVVRITCTLLVFFTWQGILRGLKIVQVTSNHLLVLKRTIHTELESLIKSNGSPRPTQ